MWFNSVYFGNSVIINLLKVKQRWFLLIVVGIFAAAIIMSSLGPKREVPVIREDPQVEAYDHQYALDPNNYDSSGLIPR